MSAPAVLEPRTTVVDVRDLTKVYRKPGASVAVHALRGVDVSISKGEYAAIMGQSGSGKSTLMNILGCLDQPTGGMYMLGDDDVSTLDDDALSEIRSRRIGFVFQQYNLIPQLTVRENLEVPMFYLGIPPRRRVERAEELAEQVGMEQRLDHRPWELSGGQQQRVCIARALMNDPLIILADEPTGALDSKTGVQILDIFDNLVAGGTTIIMVTHDPKIADHCPRVVTLCDGLVESDEKK
ncbi:MAG: ABC transporter ATP-binding protein [Planctomycetota bacterium]